MNTTLIGSTSLLVGFIAGAVCFAKYGLSIAGQVKAEVAVIKAHVSQEISGVLADVAKEEAALQVKAQALIEGLNK